MQIRDYWAVVAKRWWIIVLMVIITSGVAYAYSKAQRPIFRSSVVLLVEPARYDYGLTMVEQVVLRQYQRIMASTQMEKLVDQQLKLDLTTGQLAKQVTISPISEDLVIQMDVDNPDPGMAQRIAGTLAQDFVDQHAQEMASRDPQDRIDVSVLDPPKPGVLNWPKTRQNVLAGAFLGLLLGAIIAFVLEFLDDTVKTAEDVERFVASTVIGTIPTISAGEVRRQGY